MQDGNELGIATRVNHPSFGDGLIVGSNINTYIVYFKNKGEIEISKNYSNWAILEKTETDPNVLTLDEVETVLTKILKQHNVLQETVPISDRWKGGTIILKPNEVGLQNKEMPIDAFFHKIVMTRDRLRVMEQKINASKLEEHEKIDLQQYITRIYGSLTSFNILFKSKEHQFKGTGGND